MTRSRQGKFCGGQPPLGLMRDPDDNGHLIIDAETAPIIRRIYDLALDGFGNMKICKVLMEERIPITRTKQTTECDVNYYAWSGSRISTILRNPFYFSIRQGILHEKLFHSLSKNYFEERKR